MPGRIWVRTPLRTIRNSSPRRAVIRFSAAIRALLDKAYQTYNMTARGYNKTLKVARTIADLSGMEQIQKEHIMEALTYRNAFVERL